MFENRFNSKKTDSLVEAVRQAQLDGDIRRQAVAHVNEQFGVYNRNAVVRENLAAYDAAIEEAYKSLKEVESFSKNYENDSTSNPDKARQSVGQAMGNKPENLRGLHDTGSSSSSGGSSSDSASRPLQGSSSFNRMNKFEESTKLAKKDYDKDGKVESPKDEVWGSRLRAAKLSGNLKEGLSIERSTPAKDPSSSPNPTSADVANPSAQTQSRARMGATPAVQEAKGTAAVQNLKHRDFKETRHPNPGAVTKAPVPGVSIAEEDIDEGTMTGISTKNTKKGAKVSYRGRELGKVSPYSHEDSSGKRTGHTKWAATHKSGDDVVGSRKKEHAIGDLRDMEASRLRAKRAMKEESLDEVSQWRKKSREGKSWDYDTTEDPVDGNYSKNPINKKGEFHHPNSDPLKHRKDPDKWYSKRQQKKFGLTMKDRIKNQLGRHHKPNLPEDYQIDEVSKGAAISAYREKEAQERDTDKLGGLIKRKWGKETAKHAERAGAQSSVGLVRRGEDRGKEDSIARDKRYHSARITKGGKVHKQDTATLKGNIKRRLGSHTKPGHLPEENLDEMAFSAKAARAGKDIAKRGKQFEKIAKKAGAKYGSEERGKAVAGKILQRIRAKHMKEDQSF